MLKARQLGISWLADGYALWLCSFNKGQTVLIVSKGLEESKEELSRIRFMHRLLPPELKRPTGAPDRADRLEFPGMDSRIISLPATADAGTSYTATMVILQELSKIDAAEDLVTAITPTLSAGGKLVVVSTARGYSGTFFRMWKEAEPRLNVERAMEQGEFRPVFLDWRAHPDRDDAWYERMARTMSERSMQQEYPATPAEAFQLAGDAVFPEFDRGIHAIDGTRDASSPFPVYGGIDPGFHHGVGYLIEAQGDRLGFAFAEVHVEGGTVSDLGDALLRELDEHGLSTAEVEFFYDPAALGTNMQTGVSDADVLRAKGLILADQPDRHPPGERVDTIKTLLKDERFFVSLDCSYLIEALERAEWRRLNRTGPAMDTYRKDGVWEHPLDAAGEALVRIFRPLAADAVETIPVAVASASAVASYSGSEFGG